MTKHCRKSRIQEHKENRLDQLNFRTTSLHFLAVFWLLLKSNVQLEIVCKTVGFFLKISEEIGKAWRNSLTRRRVRREKETDCPFSIQ